MGYKAKVKADRGVIRARLREKGKNLTWLASELGIHPNTLTRYMQNGFPTIYLIALRNLLDIS